MRLTRRNDPRASVSQSVADEKDFAVNHTKQAVSILILAMAVIVPAYCESIVECLTRLLEADLVLGKVRRSLSFIPFERTIIHNAMVYPYFVKLSVQVYRREVRLTHYKI